MICFIMLLRSLVVLAITSVGKKDEEVYVDLVRSSIQGVATLNQAVSNFVLQIAEISTALAEVKRNQKKMEESLDSLERKFLRLEQERISALDDEVTDLTTSLSLTIAKIDDMMDEVLIVSGEQPAGDEKCMKVCAGSTGRSTTDWRNNEGSGIYYDVDISDCGFKTIPTVTTAIEGSSSHWVSLGTSSIYNTSPSAFRIYLLNTYMNPRNGQAEKYKWNVEWIAVGYTC